MQQFTKALQFITNTITQQKQDQKNPNTYRLNVTALRKTFYFVLRERFGLPAQMAQTVPKLATATIKTTIKQKRKTSKKYKPKEFEAGNSYAGLRVVFKRPQVMFQYNRDWSLLKTKNPEGFYVASFRLLHRRVKCPIKGGDFLEKRFLKDPSWKPKAARIVENRQLKRFYLIITFEKETPPAPLPSKEERHTFVGIDRGIKNTAVVRPVEYLPAKPCKGGRGGRLVFHRPLVLRGGKERARRHAFYSVRRRLQSRGTRSAKRRLKALSGCEKRFFATNAKQNAKKIINYALQFPHPVLVLEDLKHLTSAKTRKKKVQRGKNKSVSRGFRRMISTWHHHLLQQALIAKAEELGIPVVFVEPHYTSQTCPRCGHVAKENRARNRFKCLNCGYQNNADVTAATNIGLRCFLDLHGEKAGVFISYPTPQKPFT